MYKYVLVYNFWMVKATQLIVECWLDKVYINWMNVYFNLNVKYNVFIAYSENVR